MLELPLGRGRRIIAAALPSIVALVGLSSVAEASHFRGGNIFVENTSNGNVTVTIDTLWRKTAFVTVGTVTIRNDANTQIGSSSNRVAIAECGTGLAASAGWVSNGVNGCENTSADLFSIRRERWTFTNAQVAVAANTFYKVYVTSAARVGNIANAPEGSWALTGRVRYDTTRLSQTPRLDANIITTVFKADGNLIGPDFTSNLGAIDPDQPLSYAFITGANGATAPDFGPVNIIGDIGTQAYSATNNTCSEPNNGTAPGPNPYNFCTCPISNPTPAGCSTSNIWCRACSSATQCNPAAASPFVDSSFRMNVDTSGQVTIPGKTIRNMKDVTGYETISPGGDYVYKLRVTDATGAFSERDILLNVAKSANQPPSTPTFTGATTTEVGRPITINVTASDPDTNQTLTLIPSNVPSWMTFTPTPGNPATGVLSGTPTLASQAGTYSINVDARDNGTPQLTSSGAIVVTVTGVNQAPSITFVPNQAVATDPLSGALLLNSGTTLTINVSATDPNPNDTLTLTAFFGTVGTFPPGASFTQTGPTSGVFTWVLSAGANEGVWSPATASSGKPPLSLRVTDNGNPQLSATQQVTISVGPAANVSPALSIYNANTTTDLLTPVIRQEGQNITFDLVARDPNPADRLTIAVSGNTPLPNGATLTYLPASQAAYPNPVRYVFNWTPATGQAGTYSLQFFAVDNGSPPIEERRTVNFTISAPATPPQILSISPNQGPATGGTTVTISGTGFTGATAVSFGGTSLPFTVVSASQITFVTNAGAATTLKDVSVTTPFGSDTLFAAFQYNDNPDTDGDGIKDCAEGSGDFDSDGRPNLNDTDADGDGIPDSAERLPRAGRPTVSVTCGGQTYTLADEDGDTAPDFLDLDSDGDTYSDQVEGQADLDSDGIPNYRDLDSDGDTVADRTDNCPYAANTNQADGDGDGVGNVCDNDTDNDGLPNSQETVLGTNPNNPDSDADGLSDGQEVLTYFTNPLNRDTDGGGIWDGQEIATGTNPLNPADDDQCPNDPSKTTPGICGCGIADTNSDGDGLADCIDPCPLDALNDQDGDGRCANVDNCPTVANASQVNTDGDGLGDACDTDDDNDGRLDGNDNCPLISNADQANNDGDSLGDACDPDDDNDGRADGADNCPYDANADQANNDGDLQGDACDTDDDNDGISDIIDNCSFVANQDQTNTDGDSLGDACDTDDDGDNVPDGSDNCPLTANPGQQDADLDGVGDSCDNCPNAANANQSNADGDTYGNVCDNCPNVTNQSQSDSNADGLGDACDSAPPAAPTVALDDVNEANQAAADLTITGERGSAISWSITDGTLTISGTAVMPAGGNYVTQVDVRTLRDGVLNVSATLRDGGNNTSTAGTTTADKDTVAPTLPIVNLYDVNGLTQNAALFEVTGEVGATVAYEITDGTTAVTGSGLIAPNGTFSTNVNLSGLRDGLLTATANLTDALGNTSIDGIDDAQKDTVAPNAPSITLANASGANVTAVAFTASGEPGSRIDYTVTGGANSVSGSGTLSAAGTFSTTINVSTLAEGALSASARLTDALGNTSAAGTASSTKDTVAPAAPGVTLANVGSANAAAAALTISGEAGATIAYSVTDGTRTVSGTGTVPANGTFATTVDVSTLADGAISASATLTDALGNTGAAGSGSATKDTVAPAAPTLTLANAAIANASAVAFTVSGEAGATIAYSITSGTGAVTGGGTVPANGTFATTVNLSGLADGNLTAQATLTDSLGNTGAAGSTTAVKDTVAPGAPSLTLANAAIANQAAVALTISGEAGATIAYSVTDGTNTVSGTGAVSAAGTFSTTVNVSSLEDGTISASARLTDAVGNTGNAGSASSTKDTVAPAAPTVVLANAASANQAAVSLSISGEVGAAIAYTVSGGASVSGTGTIPAGGTFTTTVNVTTLDDGTISASATLTDALGNTGAAGSGSSTKDTVAPNAPVLVLANAASANQAAVTLTLSGEAGAAIAYSVTDGTTAVSGTGVVGANGTFSTTVDVSTLADGAISASATLTDALGNTGAAGSTSSTKDTVAPTVPGVVLANAAIANAANVALTVSGEAGAAVSYTVSDGTTSVSGTGVLSAAGIFTTTVDVRTLADGNITASATLTDALGNTSVAGSGSSTKDTVAPTAPSVVIANAAIANQAAVSLSISGEVGATIAYTVSGGASVSGTGTIPASGTFTTTVDVTTLTDGAISASATLTDALGNTSSAGSGTSTKDVVAPSAPALTLANAAGANQAAVSLTITGEAGATIAFTITGGAGSVSGSGTVGANGSFSTTVDVSSLDEGTITASATLTDALGNTGAAGSASSTKDTIAPTAPGVTLANAAIANASATAITLTGEVNATIAFSISDGSASVSGTGTIGANGSFTTNVDVSSLADGTITASATLTDALGNTSSAGSGSSTKDTVAPAAPSLTLANVNIANASGVAFSATGEAGAQIAYTISVGAGSVSGSGTLSGTGTFSASVDVSSLGDGAISASATLTDALGNTGAAGSASAQKDTVAPTTPVLTLANANIAGAASVALTITGEPNTSVRYAVTSGAASLNGTATIPAGGTFATSINTTTLPDGTLVATAILTDALGNDSAQGSASSTKDTVAPAAPGLTLSAANLANRAAVPYTVTGEPNATFNFTVSSSGGLGSVAGSGTLDATGNFSGTVNLTALANGTLTMRGRQTDVLGNQGAQGTTTATKDSTIPATPTLILNNANLATAGAVTFKVNGEVGTTIAWTISDGSGGSVTGSATMPAGGAYTTSVNLTSLADGTLSASATLTDAAGNPSVAGTTTGLKDVVPPLAPTVTLDDVNAQFAGAMPLVISGEPGTNASYRIADGSGGTPDVTGIATIPASGTLTLNLNLLSQADGNLLATVFLSDPLGNNGPSSSDSAVKDVVAPAAPTLVDLAEVTPANLTAVQLRINGTAGMGIEYTLSNGVGADITATAVMPANGQFSVNVNLSSLNALRAIVASAKLVDAVGNPSAAVTDVSTSAVFDIVGGTIVSTTLNADNTISVVFTAVLSSTTLNFTVNFPNGTTAVAAGTPITITPSGTSASPQVQVNNAILPAGEKKSMILPVGSGTRVCITDAAGASASTARSQTGACAGSITIPTTIGATNSDASGHTVTRLSSTTYRVTGLLHTFVEGWEDADGDDVHDADDWCPNSNVSAQVPTKTLLRGNLGGDQRIHGCSAAEILACKGGDNTFERAHGLTPATQAQFEAGEGWAARCR